MKQRSPEWYAARAGKITGSGLPAILGMDPSPSRAMYFKRLTGFVGEAKNQFKEDAMAWGRDNEPNAINAYEIKESTLVQSVGFVVHPDFPFIGASPDGLIGKDGVIETKCPYVYAGNKCLSGVDESLWKEHCWQCKDQNGSCLKIYDPIPNAYIAQCQAQIQVTGRSWCDFTVWTPGALSVRRIERDDAMWERMIEKIVEFKVKWLDKIIEPPRFTTKSKTAHYILTGEKL